MPAVIAISWAGPEGVSVSADGRAVGGGGGRGAGGRGGGGPPPRGEGAVAEPSFAERCYAEQVIEAADADC
jgi:hypothetical protein